MGRRLGAVGELARDRAREPGAGLLRTGPRGGRPPLSPEERRRRARERKRRWRAGSSSKPQGPISARLPGTLNRCLALRSLEQRLSQTEVAKRAGVTQSCVSQLESGLRQNPSRPILKRIAKALGVHVTELLE